MPGVCLIMKELDRFTGRSISDGDGFCSHYPREGFEGEGPEGREGGRCHGPRGPREGYEGPCRRRAEDTAPENGENPAENA